MLAVIVAAGITTAWLGCDRQRELTVTRVADRLFVIEGGNAGNTAVFVHAGGVALVDTKVAGNGQAILDAVRTVTDRPVTHIINTHTHFDHVGSNAFFPPQVEVVAQENTMGQMLQMDEFREVSAKHGLPDRTFKDRLTLFAGPDAIDLYYFGPAHTNGDAFIVFRDSGVMHAGDTFPGINAVTRNGGSEERYPETMRRAATTITGVHTVIPGHGSLATWETFSADVQKMSGTQQAKR